MLLPVNSVENIAFTLNVFSIFFNWPHMPNLSQQFGDLCGFVEMV